MRSENAEEQTKSPSLTTPSGEIRMFAGFRSLNHTRIIVRRIGDNSAKRKNKPDEQHDSHDNEILL